MTDYRYPLVRENVMLLTLQLLVAVFREVGTIILEVAVRFSLILISICSIMLLVFIACIVRNVYKTITFFRKFIN